LHPYNRIHNSTIENKNQSNVRNKIADKPEERETGRYQCRPKYAKNSADNFRQLSNGQSSEKFPIRMQYCTKILLPPYTRLQQQYKG
jgi:hypothetical protein